MLKVTTTHGLSLATILLASCMALGCGDGRAANDAACADGRSACTGSIPESSGDSSPGTEATNADEDPGDASDGSSSGAAQDASTTGSPGTPDGDADIPDRDTSDSSTTTGRAPQCGDAFEDCLAAGGDVLSCAPLYENCTNTTGSGDSGPPSESCCDAIAETCAAPPSGADVPCDPLLEICETGDCARISEVCSVEDVPLSVACTRAYLECYPGFQVNNCVRIQFDSCVLLVGDTDFCTLRADVCEDRIAYCTELVGTAGAAYIQCAERGEYFDDCWTSLDCASGAPSCSDVALFACSTAAADPLCAPS